MRMLQINYPKGGTDYPTIESLVEGLAKEVAHERLPLL